MESDDDSMTDISQTEIPNETTKELVDLSLYSTIQIRRMIATLRRKGELRSENFGSNKLRTTHPSPSAIAVALAQWSQDQVT
jgi:hypothetical protein